MTNTGQTGCLKLINGLILILVAVATILGFLVAVWETECLGLCSRTTPTSTTKTTQTLSTSYLCEAQVVFTTGGYLNQIFASPLETSPRLTPVEQSRAVKILEKIIPNNIIWYKIQYSGDEIGWIKSEFLILNPNCP